MMVSLGFLYEALKKYLENKELSEEARIIAIKNFHHSIQLHKKDIVDTKTKEITETMQTISRNVAIDTFQKNADQLLRIIPAVNDENNPIKKIYETGVDNLVKDLKKVENFEQMKTKIEGGLKANVKIQQFKSEEFKTKNVNIDTYLTWNHEHTVLSNVSRINHDIAFQKDSLVLVSNSVMSKHEVCGNFIGKTFNAREMTDDEKPQYHHNCKCYLITIPPEADVKAYKDAAVPKIRGSLGSSYVEARDTLRTKERSYWHYRNVGNTLMANKKLKECHELTKNMNEKILNHEDFKNLANPQTSRMFLKSRIKSANEPWYYDISKKGE